MFCRPSTARLVVERSRNVIPPHKPHDFNMRPPFSTWARGASLKRELTQIATTGQRASMQMKQWYWHATVMQTVWHCPEAALVVPSPWVHIPGSRSARPVAATESTLHA